MTETKSTARDMTRGSIVKQLVLFSLPLMLGNVFQMLYNTVDSVVVGNFVGTQALAAVGSTTMIVNIMVFFFNGFSTGASVVIARRFGARDTQRLHTAIQTTMAATFLLAGFFTVFGLLMVEPMLRLMATPEDVFGEARIYLQIYIGGFSGLVIYNMCSGILRAVGDTTRPLYFLILTSVLNILLDLFFVLKLRAGIAGVAYATILSQFVSAGLTLLLLTRTRDIYRLSWKGISLDPQVLGEIVAVGLPAAIQSVITSVSNVFVQSYINAFGSECMAGWSAYNKLDQFVLLPMQSLAMAATTFVSQNIGARQFDRVKQGARFSLLFSCGCAAVIGVVFFLFAQPLISLFGKSPDAVASGVLRAHICTPFYLLLACSHGVASVCRGAGYSKVPMYIMLSTWCVLRVSYITAVTHWFHNISLVYAAYPMTWAMSTALFLWYYKKSHWLERAQAKYGG